MSISLSNSSDIVANSISLINGNTIENITETFLSKIEAVSNIIGLPPTTMNTLEKISQSLSDNPTFFNTIETSIASKASTTDVAGTFSEYDNRIVSDGKLLLKPNAVDVASSLLLIDTKFLTFDNTVTTTSKLALLYTKPETDSLITSLIDGSPAVLDTMKELALALNNDADYATNVANLIATKAPQNTTYTKTEANNLLNAKANQTTTYTKTQDNAILRSKANQATT